MPKYRVKLTKHEVYNDIEANSFEEAEEIAIDYYMNDKMAFLDDKIDEIETEKVGASCMEKCKYKMFEPIRKITLCGYHYETTVNPNGIKYAHFPECKHKICPLKKEEN